MRTMFWGKNKIGYFLITFLAIASMVQSKERVLVYAAASTKPVLDAIEDQVELEFSDIDLILNSAASGILARQIKHGAPADIYISANKKWIDHLAEKKVIVQHTVFAFAANELVVVGKRTIKLTQLNDLKGIGKIALGRPETVPAGFYAKHALESKKCFEEIENQLVYAKDVRHALQLAEIGVVKAAFVYRTDGLSSSQVIMLYTVPRTLHQPIQCYMAQTSKGAKRKAVNIVANHLLSDKASVIYEKFGYRSRLK